MHHCVRHTFWVKCPLLPHAEGFVCVRAEKSVLCEKRVPSWGCIVGIRSGAKGGCALIRDREQRSPP